MRVEVRNEYLKPEVKNLSFGQKVGRFFGKALSILGPIGAAVTAVAVPGIGIPIAAGLYGLSNVAGKMTQTAEANDAAAAQASYKQQTSMPVSVPGLFEQASQAQINTDFMIPSHMNNQASITITNREMAQTQNVQSFNFY